MRCIEVYNLFSFTFLLLLLCQTHLYLLMCHKHTPLSVIGSYPHIPLDTHLYMILCHRHSSICVRDTHLYSICYWLTDTLSVTVSQTHTSICYCVTQTHASICFWVIPAHTSICYRAYIHGSSLSSWLAQRVGITPNAPTSYAVVENITVMAFISGLGNTDN